MNNQSSLLSVDAIKTTYISFMLPDQRDNVALQEQVSELRQNLADVKTVMRDMKSVAGRKKCLIPKDLCVCGFVT